MKKELFILLLASAFFNLAAGLFGPIYAVFVEEIGGDLLTAGSAYSLFAIAAGILIYFLSKWEDHIKHQEKLVIAGYALGAVGFLGYYFVQAPVHLFAVQIILGIGQAVMTPAYDGLYSRHLDKGKEASEWGTWEAMFWIVIGVAALAGGWYASEYGFRSMFLIMFALSLIGTIVSAFLVKKK